MRYWDVLRQNLTDVPKQSTLFIVIINIVSYIRQEFKLLVEMHRVVLHDGGDKL